MRKTFFLKSSRDLRFLLAVWYINEEIGDYATSNNLFALRAPCGGSCSMYVSLDYLEQLGYLTQPRKRVRRVNKNGNLVISGWWCLTPLGRRVCEQYFEIYEKALIQVENELRSDTIMMAKREIRDGRKIIVKD